jgi:hypothetical protein
MCRLAETVLRLDADAIAIIVSHTEIAVRDCLTVPSTDRYSDARMQTLRSVGQGGQATLTISCRMSDIAVRLKAGYRRSVATNRRSP